MMASGTTSAPRWRRWNRRPVHRERSHDMWAGLVVTHPAGGWDLGYARVSSTKQSLGGQLDYSAHDDKGRPHSKRQFSQDR